MVLCFCNFYAKMTSDSTMRGQMKMSDQLNLGALQCNIGALLDKVKENSTIDPSLYLEYDVKRGLRNANGTGVKAGITSISSVVGYTEEEGKKIPMEGHLLYRGIDLADLMAGFERENRLGYEEVAYLLLFGVLPSKNDLTVFTHLLSDRRNFPTNFKEDCILKIPSHSIMNKLQRLILALYSYDVDPDDISLKKVLAQSIDLIAKAPLMIAYAYQAREHYYNKASLIFHQPLENASTAENILHLTRTDSEFTRLEAEVLDLCLCVQADHGAGNNSCFANHVVSSSGTDTYSAISTAIGSLKGPRHGSANMKVFNMMKDISTHVKDWNNDTELRDYLYKILKKEAFDKTGLIYGMGHAVYTLSDPRATLLKHKAGELAKGSPYEAEYNLITNVERLTKGLLKELKGPDYTICANVDLYTGIIYHILGLKEDMFTPIFACARMSGWCAHRLEQILDSKIMRPAYVYLNKNNLSYIPLEEREDNADFTCDF